MKKMDMFKLVRAMVVSWMVVMSLGVWVGWAMNNRYHSDRESLEQQLSSTRQQLTTAQTTLVSLTSDRDYYKSRYDDGTIPSRLVKVVYQGSLKGTISNPGPESARKEFEITRDYPDKNGVIYISNLGEIAKYAMHDAKLDEQLIGYVVKQFGSTEQSGPGR